MKLAICLLSLLAACPIQLFARPHGMRVDDTNSTTPVWAVLSLIDPATGKEKELLKLDAQSLGPPVLAAGTLYVGSSANVLYALDPQSGKEKWEFKSEDHLFGVTASGNAVFVGAGGALNALDAKTGTLLWSYASDIPITDPVLVDGLVVFNSFDGPIAIDQKTGKPRWRLDVQWTYFALSALTDGRLCVWKPDEIRVVDTASGKALWQTTPEARMSAPGAMPRPAVAAGNLICQLRGSPQDAQDWSMHAFDAGSGHLLWKTALGEHHTAARTFIGGDSVYCVLDDVLSALEIDTGKLKWKATVKPLEAGGAGMLADKATVYLPELVGDLSAFDITTGRPRWRSEAPEPSAKGKIRIGGIFLSDSAVYLTRNDLQVRL